MVQTGEAVLAFKSRSHASVLPSCGVIGPESVEATRLARLSRSPLKIHASPAAVPFKT